MDDVLGCRSLVVKPFRSPLTYMRVYTGAAVLEDGTIALVLDAAYIAETAGA